MTPVFPPRVSVLFGAFALLLTISATAATLRVPQDYDLIQRAILAADPGDTIDISAGTYRENIWIDNGVTLRGAGIGRTLIIAPDRQNPIFQAFSGGTVTLSDLTLSHADAVPEVREPNTAHEAVELNTVPVILRNIRIEKTPVSYVLSSTGNLLTVENLTVAAEEPSVCISLSGTRAGTRLDHVVLPEQNGGTAITVEDGAAVFGDLKINPEQKAFIKVMGYLSDVKFPALPPEMFARIEWSFSSPDGPIPEKAGPPEGGSYVEPEDPVAIAKHKEEVAKYKEEDKRKKIARTRLVREFQASLKKSGTADATVAALAQLLPKLFKEFIGEDGYADGNVTAIIRIELRAIHDRFGPATLVKALELPDHKVDSQLKGNPSDYLAFDLQDSLAVHEGENWLKTNFPDLPALLASWKTAPKTSPAAARDQFVAMLKNLSAKTTEGVPEKAKKALTNLALAQVPAFAAQFGPIPLDQLLRALARETPPIVTLAQVSETLSAEQKTALIQLWKTQ